MDSGAILVAVLAAGRATRFGGAKLDALCAGKPVGLWALEAVEASGLTPGICVTGPEPPRFLEAAWGWQRMVNPQPEQGLAGSLGVAAGEAQRVDAAALLVLLADMPLVTPAFIAALATRPGTAATDHRGRPGVPALLPAALFPALLEARGDRGAAAILAGLPDLVLLAAGPDELLDVDTPADLARAEALLGRLR